MPKNNVYFVGYNTLNKEVFKETMNTYRADTEDAMQKEFGSDWKEVRPYLIITKCKVVVDEQSEDQGNSN
ncbi:hypothetical protein BZF66_05160 [Salmonella enterica]|uniref:hypothetical protein n=1 Tax=Salmonella enterica TaxID=28901 RepID=UPI000FDF7C4F|nr:hypothetical protein CPT_Munch_398 [Salmonella phage Munch]EAZ2022688.1 hypothetical protein [Salmonella enterica]ECV9083822.1 hypothetical protein [Salmonella enterica subsp. enterica serovar Infantis]MCP0435586.1 hypothetical protein [Salmonella enterica subsp. enterica serovar Mbandaka]EHX8550629.1 hypothetical protein [Salmonella enterica]